jgi:hypothetical protein
MTSNIDFVSLEMLIAESNFSFSMKIWLSVN